MNKGCQFRSECSYQHTMESVKGPENDLVKKVDILETLIIEMAKKVIRLEAELEELKSIKSKIIIENDVNVKKALEIKDKQQDQDKPDQILENCFYQITAKNKDEVVHELEKETTILVKSDFKCDVCGVRFKKEITLKKHFNTKHDNLNCKVCNEVFKTSMEVLKHAAKEHIKNIIANISVKEKEKTKCRR